MKTYFDNTENEALSIARVISSFFNKLFYIRFYKFDKIKWGNLKGATKYYLTMNFFNKWYLDFRIGKQDGSFSFRNEQLHHYILSRKNKNIEF